MLDGQHTVFKRRVCPSPNLSIRARADPITVPCVRVARLSRVENAKGAGLIARSINPKIKPLQVLVTRILSDTQVRAIRRGLFNDFDIAGIKMRIDVDGVTSGQSWFQFECEPGVYNVSRGNAARHCAAHPVRCGLNHGEPTTLAFVGMVSSLGRRCDVSVLSGRP